MSLPDGSTSTPKSESLLVSLRATFSSQFRQCFKKVVLSFPSNLSRPHLREDLLFDFDHTIFEQRYFKTTIISGEVLIAEAQ